MCQLQKEIWTQLPPRRFGIQDWVQKRPLTEAEYNRLWGLVRIHELPCVMTSSRFGFGLGVAIYFHAEAPGAPPEHHVGIEDSHIPNWEALPLATRWNTVWDLWTPFTHSDRNRELLKLYELPTPGSKSSYEY